MTDMEQTQYNRFVAAGYSPDLSAKLIARGAWLEAAGESSVEVVEDVRRYRKERESHTVPTDPTLMFPTGE